MSEVRPALPAGAKACAPAPHAVLQVAGKMHRVYVVDSEGKPISIITLTDVSTTSWLLALPASAACLCSLPLHVYTPARAARTRCLQHMLPARPPTCPRARSSPRYLIPPVPAGPALGCFRLSFAATGTAGCAAQLGNMQPSAVAQALPWSTDHAGAKTASEGAARTHAHKARQQVRCLALIPTLNTFLPNDTILNIAPHEPDLPPRPCVPAAVQSFMSPLSLPPPKQTC